MKCTKYKSLQQFLLKDSYVSVRKNRANLANRCKRLEVYDYFRTLDNPIEPKNSTKI